MNKKIFEIINNYKFALNTKEVRNAMLLEISAELLISAPTFKGVIVDSTSLVEETKGNIHFQIRYNDKLYEMSEFKKLAGIK